MSGPLSGIRVVELSGLGPGPFAGMLLSDMGADIIRIDRPDPVLSTLPQSRKHEAMLRNRRSVTLDLRYPEGRDLALRLVDEADVFVEGFRPGVAERLGVGPDVCLERNPRLIYARITGWGQGNDRAGQAGHDINYIAVTGALHGVGARGGAPVPPMVLAGDTGGGGTYLAMGICAALVERSKSGSGQVIDGAIVDGAASLMSPIYGAFHSGAWTNERGANRIDGGAPYYRAYACADGRYVAVGAVEDQFFAELVAGLGLPPNSFPNRLDPAIWPEIENAFTAAFATRTRDQWVDQFDGTDACVSPVLDLAEAPAHPPNRKRGLFVGLGGSDVPAPAPRFARTPSAVRRDPVEPGNDTDAVLAELGVDAAQRATLKASGAVGDASSGSGTPPTGGEGDIR